MKKMFTLCSCLLISPALFAIQVEQRGLSTHSSNLPAASTAPTAQAQTTQFWELHQQLQQLQNLVRQLRGKVEEQDNQLEQLNKELNNRYTDLDQRLELLNQKVDGDDSDTIQESTSSEVTSQSSATNTPTQSNMTADEAAYRAAYDAYQNGGAAQAIKPMESFTQSYPTSPYISHAYYWLGEFYLSLTPAKYHQAKDNFTIVAGNYPQSNKASAALYRLIEIAQNVDKDSPKAREYYLKLIQKYPQSKDAELAKSTFNL